MMDRAVILFFLSFLFLALPIVHQMILAKQDRVALLIDKISEAEEVSLENENSDAEDSDVDCARIQLLAETFYYFSFTTNSLIVSNTNWEIDSPPPQI